MLQHNININPFISADQGDNLRRKIWKYIVHIDKTISFHRIVFHDILPERRLKIKIL